jgi:hypothetical protein
MGAVLHADGQMYSMKKLIVAFRNFANTPKNLKLFCLPVCLTML